MLRSSASFWALLAAFLIIRYVNINPWADFLIMIGTMLAIFWAFEALPWQQRNRKS